MNSDQLFMLAEELREQERLQESVELYEKCIKSAREEQKWWIVGESFHMKGLVHYQLQQFDEAQADLEQAKKVFTQESESKMVAAVMRDQAVLLIALREWMDGELLLQKSIEMLEGSGGNGHLGISQVKLASLFRHTNRVQEAEQIALTGLKNIEESEEVYFESSANFELAEIYKLKEDYSQALKYAQRAVKLLNEIAKEDKHGQRKKMMQDFIESLGK